MKTGHEIEGDIMGFIKGLPLSSAIGGSVYRSGVRPRGSETEDLVVIFTTGDGAQFQSGVVTLNIYVPDIYPYGKGTPVENIARTETLERAVVDSIESLRGLAKLGGYRITLRDTVHTIRDAELKQSIVVARLNYQHFI